MAPIFAAIGITPQIIDDERLSLLKSSLESITLSAVTNKASGSLNAPLDIERLVGLLEPWQSWTFEEQVSFMNVFVRETSCYRNYANNLMSKKSISRRSIFKSGLSL
jgi:hypothetical protein